jgi:hypothetical protein
LSVVLVAVYALSPALLTRRSVLNFVGGESVVLRKRTFIISKILFSAGKIRFE